MKKLKASLLAKTVAVILFCALCLSFAVSAAALGMLYTSNYYSRGLDAAQEDLAQTLCSQAMWQIAQRVEPRDEDDAYNHRLADSDNIRYEIYDQNGVLRVSTVTGEEGAEGILTSSSASFSNNWYPYAFFPLGSLWGEESAAEEAASAETLPTPESVAEVLPTQPPESYDEADMSKFLPTPAPVGTRTLPDPNPTPTPYPATPGDITTPGDIYGNSRAVSITVVCYLLRDMTEKDNIYWQLRCFDFAAQNDRALMAAAGVSVLLALLLFIFLLRAAGHRKDTDEIKESWIEKIPFDLFTALTATAGTGVVYLFVQILDHLNRDIPLRLSAAALLFVVLALLGLLWCMSLAVRVKQGTLVKGMILYRLFHLLWRAVRGLWGWLRMIFSGIPLVWRGLLVLCGAEFIGLLIAAANSRRAGPIGLGINLFVFFPLALWALVSARKLRDGAKELAKGNTACRVETKYLFGEFRRHAEDLNAIQGGISRAVEERMRSERMKTELITNVSHDIKTPLTSIINYVDLLSREEIENEKAKEYIEVLQRQSARLKKLTDDLVEASKASSGALGVTIEDCDLGVMLEQTAGEYGEKLSEKGLELVLRRPERAITVRADARHTQRIFDNLMSNILKYALSGTRVYLELTEGEGGPAVIFRNTSRSEIVQSAEELTERFVRGDASRSSEGSGLGLSIARSLAELQGGSLAVTVDGDLFKVTLGFAK